MNLFLLPSFLDRKRIASGRLLLHVISVTWPANHDSAILDTANYSRVLSPHHLGHVWAILGRNPTFPAIHLAHFWHL